MHVTHRTHKLSQVDCDESPRQVAQKLLVKTLIAKEQRTVRVAVVNVGRYIR